MGIFEISNLIPVISKVRNRHKRGIVSTMLLAFVFNLLLPFFASYSMGTAQAAGADDLSALIGDKVLLCTSTGYRWVSLSELPGEESVPETSEHYKCPLCYLSVDKTEVIASDYSIRLSISTAYRVSTYSGAPVENPRTVGLLLGRSTRAPPTKNLL